MNPWVLLAIVLAWGSSVAVAAFKAYGAGKDSVVAQQALEERVAAVAGAAAASAAAGAVATIEVKHVNTRQILQREVIEKPVFRECRSGADSVRTFNSTLPGYPAAASQPAGNSELPASNPTP